MYRACGLLQPNSDFSLPLAVQRLTARFPNYSVVLKEDQVTISQGDWALFVALSGGPALRGELEGLVGKLAGLEPAEAESYVTSQRRVDVWSDTPDPLMEHFNDYLIVVEVLKSFRGLLAVDPKEPGVL